MLGEVLVDGGCIGVDVDIPPICKVADRFTPSGTGLVKSIGEFLSAPRSVTLQVWLAAEIRAWLMPKLAPSSSMSNVSFSISTMAEKSNTKSFL